MAKSILVVAAHPDDEVLGCGGSMARHARAGDMVNVVIMAEGITSRAGKRGASKNKTALSALEKAARAANRILGIKNVDLLALPDNRLDSLDLLDVIKKLEPYIEKHAPSVVYTHHAGDLNVDHRVLNQAVMTLCRPMPDSSVDQILFFEVASSTEWQAPLPGFSFVPNWFNDISDTLALKLKALRAYQSEMRPYPHARSLEGLEALARWRGASVGLRAAEAFMLGRHRGR